MGLFDFLKKNDKPSPEEQILNTKVQLEQLKDKYADLLEIQRRILKGDPTPREKSLAEAKIRSVEGSRRDHLGHRAEQVVKEPECRA